VAVAVNCVQEPPGKPWSGRFFRLPLNRSCVENGHTSYSRPTLQLEEYGLSLPLPSVEFSERLKSTFKYVETVTLLLALLLIGIFKIVYDSY
jgi:hypothetical protein